MLRPAPLYRKSDVISCLGIKPSMFAKYIELGIIPPPAGRQGNAHLWQSSVIHAISTALSLYGDDYTKQHTVEILFKDLLLFEAN